MEARNGLPEWSAGTETAPPIGLPDGIQDQSFTGRLRSCEVQKGPEHFSGPSLTTKKHPQVKLTHRLFRPVLPHSMLAGREQIRLSAGPWRLDWETLVEMG